MIADKVCRLGEWKQAVSYRAECSCTGHGQVVFLDYDEQVDMVTMSLYMNVEFNSYYLTHNWFDRMRRRIKFAFKVIFTGFAELEGEFIFQDESHLRAYISALNEGLNKLKKEGTYE